MNLTASLPTRMRCTPPPNGGMTQLTGALPVEFTMVVKTSRPAESSTSTVCVPAGRPLTSTMPSLRR